MDYISALKILDKYPGEIADVRIPSDKRNLCGKIADRLLNGVFNGFSSAFDMFMDEDLKDTAIGFDNGRPYSQWEATGVRLELEKTEFLGEATKYFEDENNRDMELTIKIVLERDARYMDKNLLAGSIIFILDGAGSSDHCIYRFTFDRDDTAKSLEREIRKFITPILTRYLKLVIKNQDMNMSDVSA